MTKEIVGQLAPIFKASSIAVIGASNTPPGGDTAGTNIVQNIVKGAGIPCYDSPEQCARAMHALVQYAQIRRELKEDQVSFIR